MRLIGQFIINTKGDANATADAKLVYPEKIIGTYQGKITGLGNVALFMQTIPGRRKESPQRR